MTLGRRKVFLIGSLPFIFLFLVLLYLSQEIAIVKIGYQIRRKREMLAKLKEENRRLGYRLSSLTSPRNLEREMKERGIRLCLTNKMQIRSLEGSYSSPVRSKRNLRVERENFIQGFLGSLFSRQAEAGQR